LRNRGCPFPHLRQRIQFHALVERCSREGGEIVAKGFAARGGESHCALRLARGIGGCFGESISIRVAKFAGRSARVAPVFRLGVQLLIDRLAAPIFRAIAS
jgi:hypothetical protein